jgi:hypothetical protein
MTIYGHEGYSEEPSKSLVKNPLGGNVELNPWGCDRKVI